MSAQSIELDQLRPYVAPVILEAAVEAEGEELLDRLAREAAEQARKTSSRRRKVLKTTDIDTRGELHTTAIVYREKGTPSWLAAPQLEDITHELIMISVRGSLATLCCSDGAMRDRIVKNSKSVRRIARDKIAGFVGNEAKAIWLNGVHTPTAAKADTKAMTGVDLAYSIDPIGDQTYYYSAARTMPGIPGITAPGGSKMLVGAAPAGSRIWLRRAESFADYSDLISAVLDHVAGDAGPVDVFASLAKPVYSTDHIGNAYGLVVLPEELLSEDDIDSDRREEIRRWAFDAQYDVDALAGLSLRVKPSLGGDALGTIELHVAMADGDAEIHATWVEKPEEHEELCSSLEGFLSDLGSIKIFYETGHTIAQGRCYAGGFVDQPFPWRFEDFGAYNVKQEKPDVPAGGSLAECIAVDGDNSLFAYVVEKMFCDTDGTPKGWLASDDGSMELADFIHIDPDQNVITLVHVKASKRDEADRQASPSNYEVVVSQAVKNLRHLDRRNLHDELKSGKAKKIGAAVWHNGAKQDDRGGFLKVVKKLPASATKHLVVLQPNVTAAEFKRCRSDDASPTQSMRIKQIDTLLLAARASALSCGATFDGIGAK